MKFTTLFIVSLLAILAIACSRASPPPETEPLPEGSLAFKVLDPVDNYIEGTDDILVEITAGEAEEVFLLMSTDAGSNYEKYPLVKSGNRFSSHESYEPYETLWYIAAKGFGYTTSFGSFREPKIIHKFISSGNANRILSEQGNVIHGSKEVLVYKKDHDVFVGSGNVVMDHHFLLTASDQKHSAYVIQYSTALNTDGQPITVDFDNMTLFKEQTFSSSAIGYILINSTNQGSLEGLLKDFIFPIRKDVAPFIYYY